MIDERYIKYLDREDLLFSLLTARDAEIILELEELFKDALSWDLEPSTEHLDGRSYSFTVQDKRVVTLKMPGLDEFVFSKFPEPIVNLTALRTLFLSNNLVNRILESVRK